jgi:hypothetical protein
LLQKIVRPAPATLHLQRLAVNAAGRRNRAVRRLYWRP